MYYDSYMGSAIFNSGPFNAQLCADACSMKSAYAIAHPPTDGSPVQTCQFFNTYILYINTTNNLQGQYCAMYSETWPASYATNTGQVRGYDRFLIEYSFAYSNAVDPGRASPNGAVHQASQEIAASTLQPFCSSYLGYTVPVATTTSTSTVSTLATVTAPQTVTVTGSVVVATSTTVVTSIAPPVTTLTTSRTLSIYTGTTSFVDSITTIYEPIIILTTLSFTRTITIPGSTVLLTSTVKLTSTVPVAPAGPTRRAASKPDVLTKVGKTQGEDVFSAMWAKCTVLLWLNVHPGGLTVTAHWVLCHDEMHAIFLSLPPECKWLICSPNISSIPTASFLPHAAFRSNRPPLPPTQPRSPPSQRRSRQLSSFQLLR